MSNKRDLKKKKNLFILLSTLCSEMCSLFQLSVFACLSLSAVHDNRNDSALLMLAFLVFDMVESIIC